MLKVILDKTGANEDEFFYNVMMNEMFHVYSPFEVAKNVNFPKKDKLGGVVLKFIGGGAAYFKIQRKMPNKNELESLYKVGKFLQKSFGEYVEICVLCMPNIEIRNINSIGDDVVTNFVSVRKTDGDEVLDSLTEKLENNEDFTIDDHIQKVFLPFTSRKDDDEFEEKYSIFLERYKKVYPESPDISDLGKSKLSRNVWFSDSFMMPIPAFDSDDVLKNHNFIDFGGL